jgi:hypothetical protein
MAITAYKTYAAGEILTAADLNASLTYITTNALSAISPLTGNLDVDGNSLIMDGDADSALACASDDILRVTLNNVAAFYFNGATASIVNGVSFFATATGVPVYLIAQGSDTNIDLELRSKGSGDVVLADDSGNEILVAADVASAVNELTLTNSATGDPVLLAPTGGDTNIGVTLTPKGSGTFTVAGPLTVSGVTTLQSTMINKLGADVASASALAVDIAGNQFDVTGTTSITSMNTKGVGTVIVLQFDGALTLTHHATDLILPGGQNITTAAGDIATFYEYATGDWRCISYQQAAFSGNSIVLAEYTTTGGSEAELTTAIPGWAREVDLIFNQCSLDNSHELYAVFGDAGGYETTGYAGMCRCLINAATANNTDKWTLALNGLASYNYRGVVSFYLQDATNFTWVARGMLTSGTAEWNLINGSKTLSQALTSIKLTTSLGLFDAMEITVRIK